jgi:hypothetical protein
MKHLMKFEDIKVPINIGDTVLGGRFKNKKTVVKKIGKNAKGDITINGKPLLKYRIVKESTSYEKLKEDVADYLAHLKDDGFNITVTDSSDKKYERFSIRIWPINSEKYTSIPNVLVNRYSNIDNFTWSKISDEVERFISIVVEEFRLSYLYSIKDSGDGLTFIRDEFTLDKLSNLSGDFQMKSFVIGVYKSTWN